MADEDTRPLTAAAAAIEAYQFEVRRTAQMPAPKPWRFLAVASLANVIAFAGVVYSLIGSFLSRIEGSSNSYGLGVFTQPIIPTNTADLVSAAGVAGVWEPHNSRDAGAFVSWHLTLDYPLAALLTVVLLLFLRTVTVAPPGYSTVGASINYAHVAVGLPVAYGLLSLLVTAVTQWLMHCKFVGRGCAFGVSRSDAIAIHAVTDVKWLLLVANLFLVAALYFRTDIGGAVSWKRTKRRRKSRRRTENIAVGPPVGVLVILGVFAVLVAFPGGGPLDQMPDVIRAQLDELQAGHGRTLALTFASFVLMVRTLVLVVLPATKENQSVPARPSSWLVFVVFGIATGLAFVPHVFIEHRSKAPFAYVAVFVTVMAAIGINRILPQGVRRLTPEPESPPGWNFSIRTRVITSVVVGAIFLVLCLGFVRATLPVFMVHGGEETFDRVWDIASILAALVLPPIASGLTYLMVGHYQMSTSFNGCLQRTHAAVVVLANVGLAAGMAWKPELAAYWGTPGTVMVALSFWLVIVGGFGWLTRRVQWSLASPLLGLRTPWMALLVIAWMIAGLFDSRAGYQDARTVDVPTDDSLSPALTRTMDQAFSAWSGQWSNESLDGCVTDRWGRLSVPMVIVAAPGGGGKAAYWTAYGMDSVFNAPDTTDHRQANPGWVKSPDPRPDGVAPVSFCPSNLFAAAGVSGGAIGLTTALAAEPFDPPSQDAPSSDEDKAWRRDAEAVKSSAQTAATRTARMTDQGPLSEALATMLLRDIPQPFSTIHGPWRDRAAVLEDAWADSAGPAFDGETKGDGEKTLLDLGHGWWSGASPEAQTGPVLLLSASSAGDGCRALVSNASKLVAKDANCLQTAIAGTDQAQTGSVSGTVNVLDRLMPSLLSTRDGGRNDPSDLCDDKGAPTGDTQTLRATTGALLAARFPVVTPSGTLRRCVKTGDDDFQSTYVVDGGYLENTGILTLLQSWQQVSGYVSACNALAEADPNVVGATQTSRTVTSTHVNGTSVTCPTDALHRPLSIEPWFVMLENHYRSVVSTPPSPKRPRELLVPLTTMGKKSTTLGYVPLEQAIAYEISQPFPATGRTVGLCNRFVRLAPRIEAEVEAPLGWVLASDTRLNMREALTTSRYDNLQVTEAEDDQPKEGKGQHSYNSSVFDRCD